MKSSLKKLRDLTWHRHGSKAKNSSSLEPAEEAEEITTGMRDVEAMRSQYEGLLTAAQIISSSAFDFSIALQEMAFYMVESFGQVADGGMGNIFSILSKVQSEISKFLDTYAAHVSQTLILPVESLLSELQHVEMMKGQYDEKRQLYNHVILQKSKLKSKDGKGEVTDNQLLTAKDELEEVAMALGFRLQSLKKGRIFSLITQAVRYHTAQRNLFSKCVASLDAVEPFANQLAQEHNIDRILTEGHAGLHGHTDSTYMNTDSMYNDDDSESDASSPMSVKVSETQESQNEYQVREAFKNLGTVSKSAPISADSYNQTDANLKMQEKPSDVAVKKYALPSPSGPIASGNQSPGHYSHLVQSTQDLLPSAKINLHVKEESGSYATRNDSSLQFLETSAYTNPLKTIQRNNIPVHLAEEKLQEVKAIQKNSDSKASQGADRRYGHSGPLISKKNLTGHKQAIMNNNALLPQQVDHLSKSGPLSKSAMPRAFLSSRISPSVSPPQMSGPHISELHKLPPPPPPRSAPIIAHSAPLRRHTQEPSSNLGIASQHPILPQDRVASTLPIPPSIGYARTMHSSSLKEPPVPLLIGGSPLSPTLQPIVLRSSSGSEA